jgi:hypothetical protein
MRAWVGDSQGRSTREAFGVGRAKLRLSRGFRFGLAQQCHPQKSSLGLFDHFALPERDPNSRVCHLLS